MKSTMKLEIKYNEISKYFTQQIQHTHTESNQVFKYFHEPRYIYLSLEKKKRRRRTNRMDGPRPLYGAVFYTACPIIDRFNYKRNRGGTPIDIESEYRIQIYQGVNIECNSYNAPRFYLRLQRNALQVVRFAFGPIVS